MTRSRSANPKRSKPNRKQTDRETRKSIATKKPAKTPERHDRRRTATSRKQHTDPREPRQTKKQLCLELLSRPQGVSLDDLQQVTGWQRHSIRGFLSGTVRKMRGIALTTDITDDGPRHYRIVDKHKRAGS